MLLFLSYPCIKNHIMKTLILIATLLICQLSSFGQIGWYLNVNGTLWNQSAAIPNNAKLVFGMKEGTNLTPCYNLTTAKLSMGTSVLAQPTGLKNPWNIDLATVLTGKTGVVTLEIYGKGCTSTSAQHWIVSFNASAATTTTATGTITTTTTSTAPAGATSATSLLKTAPRKQHVIATVEFTNISATATKVCFTTGYPANNAYQVISNLKINNGIVKTTTTGSQYLEFTYSNVAKGAKINAVYEYDITTYAIEMNTLNAKSKAYITTTNDYKNFTRSVAIYTDLTNTKLKSICDNLWSQSGSNYMTYAKKVTEWMAANTEWNFTGGIVPSNTFFNGYIAGSKCKGDCGSLSNAMAAMLRYKGIPARLLVGYGTQKMTATDAKFHAWMEFYIQDFGWIPVDPSYRNAGKIDIGKVPHKGIIVSHDAYYDVTILGSVVPNTFIQNYLWAAQGTLPANSYTLKFTAVSSNFVE